MWSRRSGGPGPWPNLRPEDFGRLRAAAAERLGPVALGNYVQRVRTVFKYGFDAGLLALPVRFGQSFDRPPAGRSGWPVRTAAGASSRRPTSAG